MQTSKINVRIDSDLLQRLRAHIDKSDLNKRKFVEDLLERYAKSYENICCVYTPSGYKKNAYYIIELKTVLKDKLLRLANRFDMSISDFARFILIDFDISNK